MPLNVELVKQWIEALESGKYKKGNLQLRRGDCFCAVGVLCDVIDPKLWVRAYNSIIITSDEPNPDNLIEYSWNYNTCTTPELAKKKIGLTVDDFNNIMKLSDLNNDFSPVVNKLNEFLGVHEAKSLI